MNFKMTTTFAVLPLAVFLWAGAARAGSLTAELNRTEIEMGEAAILTVSAEGSREGELMPPDVPGLVFRQQGVSQSMVFNNGHRSSELQISFAVIPQQGGDFTIPSMTMQLDGKPAATLPLTLKVRGAGGQAQAGAQAPAGGQPQGAQPPPKGAAKAQDTGGVFIERECTNAAPYAGEPIVCTIRVYNRGNLNGAQRVAQNTPDFRRIGIEGEQHYQRLVNGQRYGIIELKEVIVPLKAGDQTLPPFALQARILTYNRKNNPLDKFFDNFGGGVFNFDMGFTEEKEVAVQSEATPLAVKALPEAGKPPGFSGLVGNFQITATVSKRQLPAGDTLTITIKVEGEGASDIMADPTPALADVGKIYPDKPEYAESATADQGVKSSRTYKYALVPSKAGNFTLGQVEVPTFSPKLGQYVTLKADLGQIIVDPGKAEEKPLVVGNSAPGSTKEEIKVLGKDLIGRHETKVMTAEQTITNIDIKLILGLAGIPSLFAFSFFAGTTLFSKSKRNIAQVRRSKAHRAFREASSGALAAVSAGNIADGLSSAHRAFRAYLGDKLNLTGTALAAKEVDAQLARLGVHESSRAVAQDVFRRLEHLEFGGQTPTAQAAKELLEQLDSLVLGVEKA